MYENNSDEADYYNIIYCATSEFKNFLLHAINIFEQIILNSDTFCYTFPVKASKKYENAQLNTIDAAGISLFLSAIITNQELAKVLSDSNITFERVLEYVKIKDFTMKFNFGGKEALIVFNEYFLNIIKKHMELNNISDTSLLNSNQLIFDLYKKENFNTDIINLIYKFLFIFEYDDDAAKHKSYKKIKKLLEDTKLYNEIKKEENSVPITKQMNDNINIKSEKKLTKNDTSIKNKILKLETDYNKKIDIDYSTFFEILNYISNISKSLSSRKVEFIKSIIESTFKNSDKETVTVEDFITSILNSDRLLSSQKEQYAIEMFDNWYPTLSK